MMEHESNICKDDRLIVLKKKVYDFFRTDLCEHEIWDNAKINEKPLTRSFEFVTLEGKSMIEFTLSEIKMMPDFVRELFASPDTRKDVGHILRTLNDWYFFYFDPELLENIESD